MLNHRSYTPKHLPAPDGIETFYEVRSQDSPLPPEEFARLTRHPIHIVLDNLRSAFNVGAIFRLADATRVAEIVTCGYTAHPPHRKLESTACGTIQSVPWRHFNRTSEAVIDLKNKGIQVIGVETIVGACSYHQFDYRFPVGIIMGNEAQGISPEVLPLCDNFVTIPVFGYKNSLNVATATAVILYELLKKGGWL